MTVRGRAEKARLTGQAIEIPVRFAECDSYGVVWHGHYALYLEAAREALTGRFGFTATKALELGYRVPIVRMEIRYLRPILADTSIRVTARLRPPEASRLRLDYEIRDTAQVLLASAETEQVVVNRNGEFLVGLPAAVRKMAQEILEEQGKL